LRLDVVGWRALFRDGGPRERDDQNVDHHRDPVIEPPERADAPCLRAGGGERGLSKAQDHYGISPDGGVNDCLGCCVSIELGGVALCMWSSRPGAAFLFVSPDMLRTYATICQISYAGIRLRQAGIPLGRPSTMVAKICSGRLP